MGFLLVPIVSCGGKTSAAVRLLVSERLCMYYVCATLKNVFERNVKRAGVVIIMLIRPFVLSIETPWA